MKRTRLARAARETLVTYRIIVTAIGQKYSRYDVKQSIKRGGGGVTVQSGEGYVDRDRKSLFDQHY